MRAGANCAAAQHTLSPEAASLLRHSLSLARRRGHAQLTPLHVAATLLTSSATTLLRSACLKSQPHHLSHPLHCRALELCFNVALNRLPSAGGGLHPSLSNALVAALKRAQAHQRRGCIEQNHHQQQQPLIAVRVELEQLILSILDDPSVSRVMREAGFSSTSVKSNLEESNSVSSVFLRRYNAGGGGGFYSAPSSPPTTVTNPSSFLLPNPSLKEDIKVIMEVLEGKNHKRRNVVIVGDSLSMAEGVVEEMMGMVERGDVPADLTSAQLVKFGFSSVPLGFMRREEVDMNVADLRRKVESFAAVGRVIIYVGDLRWAVEREDDDDERERGFYSPVDHLIAEIGKLVSWYNNNGDDKMRVWVMGTANYQTYMKCQMKQPPLDVQWGLQTVAVPSGGLGLLLNGTSSRDSRIALSQNLSQLTNHQKLFHPKEEQDLLPRISNPHYSSSIISNQCHIGRNSYHYNSPYPSWPNKNNIIPDSETVSFSSYPSFTPNQTTTSRFRRQHPCHIEFNFSNESSKNQSVNPNLDSLKSMEDKEAKITLALGNSTYTNEVDSNLRDIIQENVPWQSETIPLILEALMDSEGINQNKFLFIQGNDAVGKRRLAVAIAKHVFGSSDMLFCMNMRINVDKNREMLEKAFKNREKLVVLIEDVDYADTDFVRFLFEAGKLACNAIFFLTMDGDKSYNMERDNINSPIPMRLVVCESTLGSMTPDPSHRKRKADWDFPVRGKTGRVKNYEMEEVSSNGVKKREFSRQISSNSLDLNMIADEEEEEEEDKQGGLSPVSSDLTLETTIEGHDSLSNFLKKIKNCFVLNRDSDKDDTAREMFFKKFKRSFDEASGCRKIGSFGVEETVLDEVFKGSGVYLNSLFEKWLKDIFQTSLGTFVDCGDMERVSVRLCLGGKGENCEGVGFMGTCLPIRIPVSFIG